MSLTFHKVNYVMIHQQCSDADQTSFASVWFQLSLSQFSISLKLCKLFEETKKQFVSTRKLKGITKTKKD